MDYRELKYLRRQRDARLRAKEKLYKTIDMKVPLVRFGQENELSTGLKLDIDGLTKQEMTKTDDTANELNKSQIFHQSDRKQIRFNSELNDR